MYEPSDALTLLNLVPPAPGDSRWAGGELTVSLTFDSPDLECMGHTFPPD